MEKCVEPEHFQKWFRIAVFNLLLVALLGIILRYKIVFSLPFVNQKFLLNAHSHFAFAGWVSQALMIFITAYIRRHLQPFRWRKYRNLLIANLVTAYGMLLSFPITGYATVSIIFSTLSIFASYAFVVVAWTDLNKIDRNKIVHHWFKASFVFNALSSIGAFALAFMMANKIAHPNWYLAAIYFFLHFQYNGWFLFACMGLFASKLDEQLVSKKLQQNVFYAFLFACVPTYFLSALWLPLPLWVYMLVVAAALTQFSAGIILLSAIMNKRKLIFSKAPAAALYTWCLSAIALTIKLFLQAGSTIPALSTWAYGFRPIIIGYLHLILLGVITLFILGYAMYEGYLPHNRNAVRGILIFIAGFIFNELLLLVEGLGAITYTAIPFVNELLLFAAIVMFSGLLILNVAGKKYAGKTV